MKKHENYFLLNVISFMGKKKKSGWKKKFWISILAIAFEEGIKLAINYWFNRFFK